MVMNPETGETEHYAEREYSDLLTIFLLKGAMPEKYRERRGVEVSGGLDCKGRVLEHDDWYGSPRKEFQRHKETTSAAST